MAEDGALVEIGPRFVMNPVKIFADSFTGEALWENPEYVTPAKHRRMLKANAKDKYINRTEAKARYDATQPSQAFNLDKVGHEVFVNDDEEEMARKITVREQDDQDDDEMDSDAEEKLEEHREKQDIERVKKLIEKLKPGNLEGKKLIKEKKKVFTMSGGKVQKPANKKSKMIANIIRTKKLSTKVKK